ncbi:MAG: CHAP domain-containing protein [Patescibacteria group bacterium]
MFKVRVVTSDMKQKIKLKLRMSRKITASALLLLAGLITVGMTVVPRATADNLDDQIRALQQENTANKNIVAQLQNEAVSYQDAISRLQGQINILQGQINTNIEQQNALQAKIEESQHELDRQRGVLGENIRVMYVEGQITTIEMLATSKNLSDFVDKEEYRTAIKNKIQETLKRITQLQNEMKEQKIRVERLLAEQRTQQGQLASARSEQANLLAYNKSQQASYNQKTKANQARIDGLIAQQRRANDSAGPGGYYFLRFSGSVGSFNPDNYEYRNAGFSMSTAPGCNDNDGPDRWGYCTRQCVSYAAWAVEASGRRAPLYYGNAKNWVAAAYRDGILVTRDPQAGDIAISTAGTWGHAMYVEAVDGDRIHVSQYNQQLTGQYSTQWRTFR